MIIAIDGPAGAGKSTVAKLLAKKLGFVYMDTGAMYRAITLKAIEQDIDMRNIPGLAAMAGASRIDLVNDPEGGLKVFLDGRDVSADIRDPRITKVVSDIAKIPEVRHILVELQRRLGNNSDIVIDGRDIGTVVFPQADKKFFLDAEFRERVDRRHKELQAAGSKVAVLEVEQDLANRDVIDSTRACSPLKKAHDALLIDSTHMSIQEVVDTLYNKCK